MTEQSLLDAVRTALGPQKRNGRGGYNTGGLSLNRTNGKEAYGAMVASMLVSSEGTVEWDLEDELNGLGTFSTIYEKMAADYYSPNGTLRERVEYAQDCAHEFASGVPVFSRWLMENFGAVLFRCVTPGYGNKITALTIHGSYVPAGQDRTAAEIQMQRDRDAVRGQMTSSYRKIASLEGESRAKQELAKVAKKITGKPAPMPRKYRIAQ